MRRLLHIIILFIRQLWGDYKAWLRGERRVVKGLGVRGRIYAPIHPEPKGGGMNTESQGKAVIELKVIRKDGTIEYLTVEGQVDRKDNG